jgi:hypothetical protein
MLKILLAHICKFISVKKAWENQSDLMNICHTLFDIFKNLMFGLMK